MPTKWRITYLIADFGPTGDRIRTGLSIVKTGHDDVASAGRYIHSHGFVDDPMGENPTYVAPGAILLVQKCRNQQSITTGKVE